MNIRCPYCNCHYNIVETALEKPSTDPKLGRGWWLICYHCAKKWWLKYYSVQKVNALPVKADSQGIVEKLEDLKIRAEEKQDRTQKIAPNVTYYYFGFIAALVGTYFVYHEYINNFFDKRVYTLPNNLPNNLPLLDVKYQVNSFNVDNNNIEILIAGNILNKENYIVAVNGVKVAILDEFANNVVSWVEPMHVQGVLPGSNMKFITKRIIRKINKNLRVDVSII